MSDQQIPDRPLIHGKQVWLRPMEERDLPAYVASVNDTEVGGKAGFKVPVSVGMVKTWLDKGLTRMSAGEAYFFAVCVFGSDTFIGTVWLQDIHHVSGNSELAICMDRDHVGTGWGTDALRALLDFGFGTISLRRIWLTTSADNARALRSYEKLGFRREGLLREDNIVNGRPVDSILMAMLRSEWAETPAP